jgi:uncharacterized membrane protein (DUF2068 family)
MGKLNRSQKFGLRTVAVLEAAKGVAAIAVCLLLLSLVGKDLSEVAVQLTSFLRINPDSHLAYRCVELANRITGRGIWIAFSVGCVYVCCRFVEAYGLWNQRRWGEWLAVITGSIYLPLEIYAVIRSANWINILVLGGNLLVVLYILAIMLDNRRRRESSMQAAAEDAGSRDSRAGVADLRAKFESADSDGDD